MDTECERAPPLTHAKRRGDETLFSSLTAGSRSEKHANRCTPDWTAIEADYRAGIFSIRMIAKKFGVSDTAIRKHAANNDWQRDLTGRVKEEVRRQLVREQVRNVGAITQEDNAIIRMAARQAIEVVRDHKQTIGRLHRVVAVMASQLEQHLGIQVEQTAGAGTTPQLQKSENSKLPIFRGRADSVASLVLALTAAFERIVRIERQAFGIEDEALPPALLGEARAGSQVAGRAQVVVYLPDNGRSVNRL